LFKLFGRHPVLPQMLTFGAVSGLGAVFDIIFSLIVVELFGTDLKLALLMSMCVSGLMVYLLHGTITFRRDLGRISAAGAGLFLVSTAVIYGLRSGVVLTLEASRLIEATGNGIALVLAIGIGFVVNFAISKTLIFRGR